MLAWLKAAWLHLVWEEKKLFKSSTMWLAALIGIMPQALTPENLQYVQQNWPTFAPYLPHLLQEKGLAWLGVLIFLCRLHSMLPAISAKAAAAQS